MIDWVIWNHAQRLHFFLNYIYSIELYQCASITYHLSSDDCKGSDLDSKCKGTGEQLARITDLASLNKAKQAITNPGIKYWTGLRWDPIISKYFINSSIVFNFFFFYDRHQICDRVTFNAHSTLGEGIWKRRFHSKTHHAFFVLTSPDKFKNATSTGHFGFVLEENTVREITWLSWHHRTRTIPVSRCVLSTPKRKAGVYTDSSSESSLKSVFEKLRFREGLVWMEGLTGEINLPFLNSSSVVYIGAKIDLVLDGDPYLLKT